MNFLQQLAATAIRNQVVAALRADCPAELNEALETLLSDGAAVNTIRDFVMAHMKTPADITAAALTALPYADTTAALLQSTPALARYLADTAKAKLPH